MSISTCSVTTTPAGEEIKKHGTLSFPIAIYDLDVKYSVAWHWHEELELIYVTSGSAIVSINNVEYLIKENEGAFINANILHEVHSSPDSEGNLMSIVFHPRLVGGSIDSVYWQNYVEPLIKSKGLSHIILDHKEPWHNELLLQVQSIWNKIYQGNSGYEILARNELSEAILLIHSNYALSQLKPSTQNLKNAKRIKIMLQYIHEHFSEDVTISSLATEAFISNSEVLRCFHNMIKTTPTQYLKQYRIQKACELLETTDYNSVKIGMECGFQSSSYFIKTFKEKLGSTPLEYRKALKK